MLNKLPNYYKKSEIIKSITDIEDAAIREFINNINKTVNEFFIDTSEYTLDRWERELEIPVNKNFTTEERRERVLSKVRGTGTVTIKMIQNVIKSFTNGEVDIIEDNANSVFTVKFIDIKGVPANMEIVKQAIDEIKPAHLEYKIAYKYTVWNEIKNKTWNNFIETTWSELMSREVM